VKIVNFKNENCKLQQQYRLLQYLQHHYWLQDAAVKVGGRFLSPLLSCL
jgi:hypothetical protein